MTRNDWLSGLLGVAFLLTLIVLPAQTSTPAPCYRTKAGWVCPQQGQAQTGGSGITPVKRWKN